MLFDIASYVKSKFAIALKHYVSNACHPNYFTQTARSPKSENKVLDPCLRYLKLRLVFREQTNDVSDQRDLHILSCPLCFGRKNFRVSHGEYAAFENCEEDAAAWSQ